MASQFPGEFSFIEWVKTQQPPNKTNLIGIGDDCAVLPKTQQKMLVTTDMLMEGSCFILAEAGAYRVGRKAMAVNLSDIAAMAGVPKYAFISLGLPRTMPYSEIQLLHRGMQDVANQFGVIIAGGDTNTWDGPLTVSITLIGETRSGGAVLRSGAQVDDWIFVSGSLGGSILGHHLDFVPRVQLAAELSAMVSLHAMVDISDGLAKDFSRILNASQVGAVILQQAIPINPAARKLAKSTGKRPLEHALGDGEDFELVFTVSAVDGERLQKLGQVADIPLSKIGEIVEEGFWLQNGIKRTPLQPMGYEHQFVVGG